MGGASYFAGALDDVAIYPAALSAATVAQHYALATSAPAPNAAPPAEFISSVSGLDATVDGTASADADGSVASYAWDFGDGATATGATATGATATGATAAHPYTSGGTFTVTLTVTDDDGATGTTKRQVTVTAPPAGPAVLADDTFGRTASGGLGTADTGGVWTVSAGGTRQSVTPGVAELRLDAAGNNTGAFLGGISQAGADVTTTFSVATAPTGNGTYVYVTGRRVGAGLEYRVRVRLLADGRVGLALSRLSGGTEAFPGGEVMVPGLTYTAGQALNVRIQVSGTGTTQVTARAWLEGSPEPVTPSLTRADATAALQEAGGVGLTVHRPSGTTVATAVRFTAFRVTELP